MGFIIFLVIVLAAIFLFGSAWVLNVVLKLFKIQNPSYKKSILIIILIGIIEFVLGLIFGVLGLAGIGPILITVLAFIAFHLLLKKYYQSGWGKSLGVYVVSGIAYVIFALIIIIPMRMFVIQPFYFEGDSMSPTYNKGDYVIFNQLVSTYERGDVVVFRHPPDSQQFYVKRIVGLPTETIEIKDGALYVNDKVIDQDYIPDKISGEATVSLGANEYFMLGDNIDNSFDSRNFGAVTRDSLMGVAMPSTRFPLE